MRLSKPVALLLLAATLLPILYIGTFICVMIAFSMQLGNGPPVAPGKGGGMPPWFIAWFIVHMGVTFWNFALLGFYMVLLFKSKDVPKDQKVLWAIVLIF